MCDADCKTVYRDPDGTTDQRHFFKFSEGAHTLLPNPFVTQTLFEEKPNTWIRVSELELFGVNIKRIFGHDIHAAAEQVEYYVKQPTRSGNKGAVRGRFRKAPLLIARKFKIRKCRLPPIMKGPAVAGERVAAA
jgi:hypothetical protein